MFASSTLGNRTKGWNNYHKPFKMKLLPGFSRPHINIKVNGTVFTALLDAGADVTAMNADLIKTLLNPMTVINPGPSGLKDVQNGPLQSLAKFSSQIRGPHGLTANFPMHIVCLLYTSPSPRD